MAMAPQSAVATGYYASGNEGGDPSRLAPDRSGRGIRFSGASRPVDPWTYHPAPGRERSAGIQA